MIWYWYPLWHRTIACWRETWFPCKRIVLSPVRPMVAVLLTSLSNGSPPGEVTRNFAGISSRYDATPVNCLPATISPRSIVAPCASPAQGSAGDGLNAHRAHLRFVKILVPEISESVVLDHNAEGQEIT